MWAVSLLWCREAIYSVVSFQHLLVDRPIQLWWPEGISQHHYFLSSHLRPWSLADLGSLPGTFLVTVDRVRLQRGRAELLLSTHKDQQPQVASRRASEMQSSSWYTPAHKGTMARWRIKRRPVASAFRSANLPKKNEAESWAANRQPTFISRTLSHFHLSYRVVNGSTNYWPLPGFFGIPTPPVPSAACETCSNPQLLPHPLCLAPLAEDMGRSQPIKAFV